MNADAPAYCTVRDWATGGRCGLDLDAAGRCRRHGAAK